MNNIVGEVLQGSFDLHVHASPDPYKHRRLDVLETARVAYEAEMAGFVLKSHDYPTASLAYVLNRMYPGLTVAGSITLNQGVGGLNPAAVEIAARMGAKVVWMPTRDADFFQKSSIGGTGLELTDHEGNLLHEVDEILDIILVNEMALASGHISTADTLALFKKAQAKGIKKMIATHPAGVATVDEQRQMASYGAMIEHTFLACMPPQIRMSLKDLVSMVRILGVENCILTTDFGQWMNPPPAEGMRMAIACLLEEGLGVEEVSALVKENPMRLLGSV